MIEHSTAYSSIARSFDSGSAASAVALMAPSIMPSVR